jgi:hypothetical protein
MNIPEVGTWTTTPPPRVIYHDFNDDTEGGVLAYVEPRVGERLILADSEGISVWAIVRSVSGPKSATRGVTFWLVGLDVQWDTLRNS